VLALTDSYNVFDENLQPIYKVKSKLLSLLSNINLYDMSDNELFLIKRKFTFMLAEYEIYKGETLHAKLKQEFSFFKPKLKVTSPYGDYEIQGELFAMNFKITFNGELLGTISKKALSLGDSYKLEIADEKDATFFTALAIAIDNCLHNGKK